MLINIKEFKNNLSKINLAIEKAKLNPKAGWIELQTVDDKLHATVCNFDYFLNIKTNINLFEDFHVTVSADTFIPLISKLDDDIDTIELKVSNRALLVQTNSSEYTFPLILDNNKPIELNKINIDYNNIVSSKFKSSDISSIANANVKGLVDSIFSNDIQQYIYIDTFGAITFTENIYINDFIKPSEIDFKFLLNLNQAKLLKIFEDIDEDIIVNIEQLNDYNKSKKISFNSKNIDLVLITQSQATTDKFPSIKLRQIANKVCNIHAVIDKKVFEKALNRLMVFDKKFDITVLNYSQLEFNEDSVKLVSVKNHNYEIIPYIKKENTISHKIIIRFADLQKQLKAISSKEIDISYGESAAIVINSDIKQLIPGIQMVERI